MEYKRRNKLWAQNINGKKRRSDMEGMLDNPRNILLWITSESTSSESQNSLFVELHHTSIICLTSRSIKLMIEALFCSGNYVFSFAQLLQILISISETVLSWYHGQVSGCVRMLLLPQLGPLSWLFISSPRCRHRAHRSLASALYTITIGTTCVSTGKKKCWPPNGCLHDKNHFKIE